MRVLLVDREDQLRWYVDDSYMAFDIQLDKNHKELMDWILECTTDKVIIFSGGVIPEPNSRFSFYELFGKIRSSKYVVYFETASDATIFKLKWGTP
jgi:hypothetical protein